MSKTCDATVLTPVGLAMWRPMAEAMGWPEDPISWAELIELANDPQGWASYGHPEWGRLRLGHTHPQYSSAGLLFLTSVIYAIIGKTDIITPDDIYAPEVESGLTALAQNTARYGIRHDRPAEQHGKLWPVVPACHLGLRGGHRAIQHRAER